MRVYSGADCMNDLESFTKIFSSAVRMLGGNPAGGMLQLPSGAVAGASGVPFAGENYVMFTEESSEEDILAVLDFFNIKGLPFVIPLLPFLSGRFRSFLASRGFEVRSRYNAMSISTERRENPRDDADIEIFSDEQRDEWGEVAWVGFGGKLPVPFEFHDMINYFSRCESNSLFSLRLNGHIICTGLLHHNDGMCWLDYFATLPEFRHMGLAERFMEFLLWQTSRFADTLFLLSTEMGFPMYRHQGFISLADVPMLSLSRDVDL